MMKLFWVEKMREVMNLRRAPTYWRREEEEEGGGRGVTIKTITTIIHHDPSSSIYLSIK